MNIYEACLFFCYNLKLYVNPGNTQLIVPHYPWYHRNNFVKIKSDCEIKYYIGAVNNYLTRRENTMIYRVIYKHATAQF